jgi:hypothetical protein
MAKCLVEAGVDINAVNNNGETALHLASYKSFDALTDYLLAVGADRGIKSVIGKTYLDVHRGFSNESTGNFNVIDARSESARQNEADGRAGINIPPVAAELYELLVQARAWGRSNGWPVHEEYPQWKRVREIGEMIDEEHGFDEMQRVAYYIDARNRELTSHLTQFWHCIGQWLA